MYHRFGNVQTNFLVEGFYTDLRDVFRTAPARRPDANGNAVLERYNGSGATVFGLNLEAKAFFSSHFDIQGGVTPNAADIKSPKYGATTPMCRL